MDTEKFHMLIRASLSDSQKARSTMTTSLESAPSVEMLKELNVAYGQMHAAGDDLCIAIGMLSDFLKEDQKK